MTIVRAYVGGQGMSVYRNTVVAMLLGGMAACMGEQPEDSAEVGEDVTAMEREEVEEKLMPLFSAEVLFPATLLTPLDGAEEWKGREELLRMQALLREVKAIEKHQKGINDTDRAGMTALMSAAQQDARLITAYLVAKGADVEKKDRQGKMAVDYAKEPCIKELLTVCMEEKAELQEQELADIEELIGDSQDGCRERLWDSVNYQENVREVAQLLKYGVNPNGYYRGRLIIEGSSLQPECLAYLVRHGYKVNVRRQDGKTPFCSVTREDNVRLLLALGMQPDADDAAQCSLLWNLLHTNAIASVESEAAASTPWENAPLPRVEVYFERACEASLPADQRHTSLGASGYLFVGRMMLWDENGECVVTQDVQTGGWMSLNSPFRRMGNYPRNAYYGAYDPLEYPDTAFPVLTEVTSLATERTTALQGYHIPDPPGTGRTGLFVHSSERLGSEGCISVSGGAKWAVFCGKMDHFRAQGREEIPLRVVYLCKPPEPTRREELAQPSEPLLKQKPYRRRRRR